MPRPRVTFSRNGMTSEWPSGPPKERSSSASRRPGGAGSADGATPPLLRTASDGSSSGRRPGGVIETSDANGMEPAVHVHDLAGGGGEPVRQQGHDGLAGGLGVGYRPAQRRAPLPGLLELLAAGDRLHRHAAQRPGLGKEDPITLAPELARQLARGRL